MKAFVPELAQALDRLPPAEYYEVGRIWEVEVTPVHQIMFGKLWTEAQGPEIPPEPDFLKRAAFKVERIGFGTQPKKVWALITWPE